MSTQASKNLSKFSKKELDSFFAQAKAVHKSQAFTILAAPRSEEHMSKILIIASRKYGNAPERNLIRRRLKAIFYEAQLYEQPYDIAVIARRSAQKISFQKIQEILINVVTKI